MSEVKSSLMRTRWAAIGAAVAVSMGAGVVVVANAAVTPDTGFKAIKPCRLLDTRTTETSQIKPLGIWAGKIDGGASASNDISVIFDPLAIKPDASNNYTYKVPGSATVRAVMGACNGSFSSDENNPDTINSGDTIKALVLNVTIVENSSGSFVTVYPWQALGELTPRPLFSNLNPQSGLGVVTNQVTVNLRPLSGTFDPPNVNCTNGSWDDSNCGTLKAFRVYNNAGTAHVIIDVMGYYYA